MATNRKHGSEIPTKQDDYMDNEPTIVQGTQRLLTWFIHGGKIQIHIVDAAIKQVHFDMLVIPMNEDFVGQPIDGSGIKGSYGYIKPYNTGNVVFGDVVWCKSSKDIASQQVSLAVLFNKTVDNSQLNGSVRNTAKDILREAERSTYRIIGIQASVDDGFIVFVRELLQSSKDHFTGELSVFLCMDKNNSKFKKLIEKVDSLTQESKLPRRLCSRSTQAIFPRLKIRTKIDRSSLLECQCESVVAAIGNDLKLNKGFVTSGIAKAAGKESQNYLDNLKQPVKYWDVISCNAGNLRQEGVKFLLFGCIPKWEKKEKIQELLSKFIFGCLLKAEESGCSSMAIPLLGTGRLLYPEHTVLISILDGIELFSQLGTLGKLKDVVIASPSIDNDAYDKYVREIQRRGNKITRPLFKHKDAVVLRSIDTSDKYMLTVVKEEQLQEQLPVEFVELVLNNRPGEKGIYRQSESDRKLQMNCEINEHTLAQVVQQAISKCENEKVTALVVYTSNLPKISAVRLVEEIRYLFEKHPNIIYLHKVMVVISNVGDFNECRNILIKKKTDNGVPKWKEERSYFDDEVYITDVNQSHESTDTKDTPNEDSVLVLDMVTVEVNPGISQYLKTSSKTDIWKEKMESAFNITVCRRNGMITLEGSLNDILKVEAYFENTFPKFPDVQSSPDTQKSLLSMSDEESETQELVEERKSDKQTVEVMKDSFNVLYKKQSKYKSEKDVPRNSNDKDMETTTRHIPKKNHSPVYDNKENQIDAQQKQNTCKNSQKPNFMNAKPDTKKTIPFQFGKISVYVYASDITTVTTRTIVCPDDYNFTHSNGMSKYILNKAGMDSLRSWNQLKSNNLFRDNICFVTPAGMLQFQKIMHVLRPMKLENIHLTISNILYESNRLSIASVAIPTIGAGAWKDDVKSCAEQYYKAIKGFSDAVDVSQTTVKEIHIVDTTEKTIDTVRCTFERNLATVSEEQSVPADILSLAIFSNTVAVTSQCMLSFQTDIKVFITNTHLTGENGCTKKALLNCPKLNTYFKNKMGEKYEVAHVRSVSVSEHLFCRTAIVAIHPWPPSQYYNKDRNDEFKSDIRKTMKNIMEMVHQLNGSTVAIPLLTESDKSEVIGTCCSSMAEELIKYAQTSPFKWTVYIVTDNETTCKRFHSVLGNLLGTGKPK